MMLVAGYGLVTRFRIAVNRQLGFQLLVMLWLVTLAQYALLPHNQRYIQLFASQQIAYLLAQLFMWIQVAYFYVLQKDHRLGPSFALNGCAAVSCLLIVQVTKSFDQWGLVILVSAFVVTALVFWSDSRRNLPSPHKSVGRIVAMLVTLILILTSGLSASWLLRRYETQLDQWVMSILDPELPTTNVGFGETASIGSVRFNQSQQGQIIALRVDAESEPGYLRGKAYDTYADREWQLATHSVPVQQMDSAPTELQAEPRDGGVFRVRRVQPGRLQSMVVRPANTSGVVYFAPLETAYLQTSRLAVTRDQHDLLRADVSSPVLRYRLWITNEDARHVPDESPNAAVIDDLVWVPRALRNDDAIQQLAAKLFPDGLSTFEKIEAVQRYFGQFEYGLTVNPPRDQDPVAWFLINRPAAHCEYFASGSALLLRLAGVPTRYVTGFVVDEKNSLTGEFVARNKDAHAWCEARLEDGRWVLVESTPSNGLPDRNGPSDQSEWLESVASLWQQLIHAVWQRGINAVLKDGLLASMTALFKVLSVVSLFALAIAIYRRQRRARSNRVAPLYESHAWHRRLNEIDQEVAVLFRPRALHETLTQYATALERHLAESPSEKLTAALDWYRHYDAVRYQSPSHWGDDVKQAISPQR